MHHDTDYASYVPRWSRMDGDRDQQAMIIVVEPVSCGIQHTPVNAAMLEIIRLAFPEQPVCFYAEAAHLAEVQTLLSPSCRDTIRSSVIRVPPRQAGSRERFPIELQLLRRLFAQARDTSGYILLLSAFESTIFAVKALHALSRNKVPVQALLHGNLNEVVGWRSRNPLVRAFDLHSALSFGLDDRLKYLVLESSIAGRLVELFPRLKGAVHWLGHPIPPGEGAPHSGIPPFPLNIAFLGLATEQKGFDVFVETAREVTRRHPGRVEFHAIGRLPPNAPKRDLSALTTTPQHVGLPRECYVEAVTRTHYVCLPYQGTHYELSASGVLLDALAWCKPIISLPSPTVRTLFAANPNIGYFCATRQELIEAVVTLANNFNEDNYRMQANAMSEIRRLRLPEALSQDYRKLTESFFR